jgi:hypothetical protein
MLCAICDDTNATTKICNDCRKLPENDGWGETWEQLEASADQFADRDITTHLSDMVNKRRRPVSSLVQAILDDIKTGTEEHYQYVDPAGRRFGTRTRRRPLTVYEIAKRRGCSPSYAARIRRIAFRLI